MSGPIDGDSAAETMHQIYAYAGLARLITVEDVRNVEAGLSRYDTVMPILDPTSYRDTITGPNSDANREIVGAFATFRRELERIVGRHPHLAEAAGGQGT